MIEIVIEDHATFAGREPVNERLLALWARDLPRARVDLLGVLPVIGVNTTALDALAAMGGIGGGGDHAMGLFLADPFLRVVDLAERLRALGARHVANFPTLQVVDGEAARALDAAGLGSARELATLVELAGHGFSLLPFVSSLPAAMQMVEAGATSLVLHPGIAGEDWRARAAAALALGQWLPALRREAPACRILIYAAPGYGEELQSLISAADGIVRWSRTV